MLLHNVTASPGHWLMIHLVGTKSNRDGIGAKVEVVAGGLKQVSQRVAGSGYLSQDDWRLHFGLGANTQSRQDYGHLAERHRANHRKRARGPSADGDGEISWEPGA